MSKAKYKTSPEEDVYYGEIPDFEAVTARAESLEQCRHELVEALEEWIFSRVSRKLALPVIDGLYLSAKEVM
ncbi:MAG: type II toxin-antitoxin system HicB family antitoxin [Leptolyngbyaceae cyanobacterium SU_3_3]|nr:type II toxin-antitoxin system HicB family antitoxin [Leptolyngbyaceae cyanobacterium SU_3_3]